MYNPYMKCRMLLDWIVDPGRCFDIYKSRCYIASRNASYCKLARRWKWLLYTYCRRYRSCWGLIADLRSNSCCHLDNSRNCTRCHTALRNMSHSRWMALDKRFHSYRNYRRWSGCSRRSSRYHKCPMDKRRHHCSRYRAMYRLWLYKCHLYTIRMRNAKPCLYCKPSHSCRNCSYPSGYSNTSRMNNNSHSHTHYRSHCSRHMAMCMQSPCNYRLCM